MITLIAHHHPADSSYASIVVWIIGAALFIAIAVSELRGQNKNNIF